MFHAAGGDLQPLPAVEPEDSRRNKILLKKKKKLKSCLQEENLLMPAGLCRRTPELKASHWPVTWRWHWSIRLKSQSPFKLDWILWGL